MRDEAKKVEVLCKTLFQLEREAQHLEHELEDMVDEVPSKFRKHLRELITEADHIRDMIGNIKGLHWRPDPGYEGPFD